MKNKYLKIVFLSFLMILSFEKFNSIEANDYLSPEKSYPPFFQAIYNGNIKLIKKLLVNKNILNKPKKDGMLPLHYAIKLNKGDVARLIIDAGADIHKDISYKINIGDFGTYYGYGTPLHFAAGKGNEVLVEYLISKGAKANFFGSREANSLLPATQNGNLDIVKFLIKHGASLNAIRDSKDTLLHCASENGHLHLVEFYLKNGFNIDHQGDRGKTPLYLAVKNKKYKVVNFLLDNGADVNIYSKEYKTPLHIAFEKFSNNSNSNEDKIITKIISKVDNFYFLDKNGHTYLYHSINKNNVKYISYLLKKIEPVKIDLDESFEIYSKVIDRKMYDVLLKLLNNGLKFHKKKYPFAISLALKQDQNDIVKILLKNDLKEVDWQKFNWLLSLSLEKGNIDLSKFLINNQIDLNYIDKKGNSPLNIAVEKNFLSIVKMIVDKGVDLKKYIGDQNPLFLAVPANNIEMVNLLLKLRLELNHIIFVSPHYSYTILDLAKSNEMRKILIKAGAKSAEELKKD